MADKNKNRVDHDRDLRDGDDANRDPITKAPGSHPVGTGVGAAAAGTAGAAIGAMAGPVGAVAGAIIGAVAGGAAGHAVGEKIDPTVEDAYWRENYSNRDYVTPGSDYEEYRPAYQYGWENYGRNEGRTFEEAENDLSRDWETYRGNENRLEWDRARHATRDSWNRLRDRFSSNPENRDYDQNRGDLTTSNTPGATSGAATGLPQGTGSDFERNPGNFGTGAPGTGTSTVGGSTSNTGTLGTEGGTNQYDDTQSNPQHRNRKL